MYDQNQVSNFDIGIRARFFFTPNSIYGLGNQQTEFVFLVLTFDNCISKVKDHDANNFFV